MKLQLPRNFYLKKNLIFFEKKGAKTTLFKFVFEQNEDYICITTNPIQTYLRSSLLKMFN